MNRPVTLVCYICGREFGTKSLAIHVKACEKKWENEQNLKPPKERRPCPQAPKGFGNLVSKDSITKEEINAFNGKSYDTFVEDALIGCQYCGRKFNPKSLVPHQKACKTSPMIRKHYVGAKEKVEEESEKVLVPSKGYSVPEDIGAVSNQQLQACRNCGRKFASDRVAKHEKVCQGEKLQKPKQEAVQLPKPTSNKVTPKQGADKKAKWQIQHEQLQKAMKQMKKLKAYEKGGGKLSDLPPPPPSNYDDYVQCKYCGRKYAANVAERHIPKCANIVNKPGGIKPSTIQQKYIGGTGAASKKMEAPKSVQSTAVKPTISNGVKPIISAKSSAATKKY